MLKVTSRASFQSETRLSGNKLIVGALFLVLIVAAIPGKLAKKRHSPWVEAINVAELIGVLLLLGRYPSAELKTTSALATSPPPVPAGLPSQLLERRPDVVAAEHSFNAAFHLAQTAETARLPSISLTGAGGYATNALLQDLRCEPWTRKLAGQLLAPIYTGGYLQAQVRIADQNEKAALALYGQTALQAFDDVKVARTCEHYKWRKECS